MTSSVTPPDQHPQANTQGPWIERLFFKHRVFWCVLFVIVTLLLGWRATMVKPEASFEKLIPLTHPYIENLMARRDDLKGLANSVRIAVTVKGDGDIFDADYMAHLRKVYDEVMFMPGVDRSAVKSLWAPSVRWTEVTEAGFAGGTVIPDTYCPGSCAGLIPTASHLAPEEARQNGRSRESCPR